MTRKVEADKEETEAERETARDKDRGIPANIYLPSLHQQT